MAAEPTYSLAVSTLSLAGAAGNRLTITDLHVAPTRLDGQPRYQIVTVAMLPDGTTARFIVYRSANHLLQFKTSFMDKHGYHIIGPMPEEPIDGELSRSCCDTVMSMLSILLSSDTALQSAELLALLSEDESQFSKICKLVPRIAHAGTKLGRPTALQPFKPVKLSPLLLASQRSLEAIFDAADLIASTHKGAEALFHRRLAHGIVAEKAARALVTLDAVEEPCALVKQAGRETCAALREASGALVTGWKLGMDPAVIEATTDQLASSAAAASAARALDDASTEPLTPSPSTDDMADFGVERTRKPSTARGRRNTRGPSGAPKSEIVREYPTLRLARYFERCANAFQQCVEAEATPMPVDLRSAAVSSQRLMLAREHSYGVYDGLQRASLQYVCLSDNKDKLERLAGGTSTVDEINRAVLQVVDDVTAADATICFNMGTLQTSVAVAEAHAADSLMKELRATAAAQIVAWRAVHAFFEDINETFARDDFLDVETLRFDCDSLPPVPLTFGRPTDDDAPPSLGGTPRGRPAAPAAATARTASHNRTARSSSRRRRVAADDPFAENGGPPGGSAAATSINASTAALRGEEEMAPLPQRRDSRVGSASAAPPEVGSVKAKPFGLGFFKVAKPQTAADKDPFGD